MARNLNTKEEHFTSPIEKRKNVIDEFESYPTQTIALTRSEVKDKPSPEVMKHYRYILPLVRDVHQLELKIKDKQKELELLNQQKETRKLAKIILADSLNENQCVLKRWSRELQEKVPVPDTQISDFHNVSNVVYHVNHTRSDFEEHLTFTVLSGAVYIRVKVHSKMKCSCFHLLSGSSAHVGVESDTFVPGLDAEVRTSLAKGKPVSDIVLFVSNFILKDVAPFVIVIPMKKVKKKKKKTAE